MKKGAANYHLKSRVLPLLLLFFPFVVLAAVPICTPRNLAERIKERMGLTPTWEARAKELEKEVSGARENYFKNRGSDDRVLTPKLKAAVERFYDEQSELDTARQNAFHTVLEKKSLSDPSGSVVRLVARGGASSVEGRFIGISSGADFPEGFSAMESNLVQKGRPLVNLLITDASGHFVRKSIPLSRLEISATEIKSSPNPERLKADLASIDQAGQAESAAQRQRTEAAQKVAEAERDLARQRAVRLNPTLSRVEVDGKGEVVTVRLPVENAAPYRVELEKAAAAIQVSLQLGAGFYESTDQGVVFHMGRVPALARVYVDDAFLELSKPAGREANLANATNAVVKGMAEVAEIQRAKSIWPDYLEREKYVKTGLKTTRVDKKSNAEGSGSETHPDVALEVFPTMIAVDGTKVRVLHLKNRLDGYVYGKEAIAVRPDGTVDFFSKGSHVNEPETCIGCHDVKRGGALKPEFKNAFNDHGTTHTIDHAQNSMGWLTTQQ